MENPATAGFWLSPQQKCVWSLQNDGRVYGSACMLIFEGVESPDSLAAVTEHLVARHEILRTVYVRQPGMTYPFQVVLDNGTPPIQALDLSGMSAAEQTSKLNDLFLAAQVRSQGPERAPFVYRDSGRNQPALAFLKSVANEKSAERYEIPVAKIEARVESGGGTGCLEYQGRLMLLPPHISRPQPPADSIVMHHSDEHNKCEARIDQTGDDGP